MLGLDLPKIDLSKMVNAGAGDELVFRTTLNDLYKRHDTTDAQAGKEAGKPVRVGLMPELEQLMRK